MSAVTGSVVVAGSDCLVGFRPCDFDVQMSPVARLVLVVFWSRPSAATVPAMDFHNPFDAYVVFDERLGLLASESVPADPSRPGWNAFLLSWDDDVTLARAGRALAVCFATEHDVDVVATHRFVNRFASTNEVSEVVLVRMSDEVAEAGGSLHLSFQACLDDCDFPVAGTAAYVWDVDAAVEALASGDCRLFHDQFGEVVFGMPTSCQSRDRIVASLDRELAHRIRSGSVERVAGGALRRDDREWFSSLLLEAGGLFDDRDLLLAANLLAGVAGDELAEALFDLTGLHLPETRAALSGVSRYPAGR